MEQLEENIRCSICYEVFTEPVTLTCGHTFCLSCLAKWYFTNKRKKECTMCFNKWNELPKINYILQDIIKSNQIHVYHKDIHDDLVEKFKSECRKKEIKSDKYQLWNELIGAAVYTFILSTITLLVLQLVWPYSETLPEKNLYKHENVSDWSSNETYRWLSSLGTWTYDRILPVAKNLSLNGSDLLMLNRTYLNQEPFLLNLKELHLLLNEIRVLILSQKKDRWSSDELFTIYSAKLSNSVVALMTFPRVLFIRYFLFDRELVYKFRDTIQFGHNSMQHDNSSLLLFFVENLFFPYLNIVLLAHESTNDSNILIKCFLLAFADLFVIVGIIHDFKE